MRTGSKTFSSILIAVAFLAIVGSLQFFESQNPEASILTFGDACWFTIVTLTTVGYGDLYPITPVGKALGLIVILCSLGLISFCVGQVSTKIGMYMEKKKLGLFGIDTEDHIIVIGWNEFSKNVVDQLIITQNNIVLVVNNKEDIDLVNKLYQDKKVFSIFVEDSNYELLNSINIKKSSSVFLSMNSDSEMLVYVLNLLKVFGKLNIIVTINRSELKEPFLQAGVKHVVSKNEIASKLAASYIFEPDVAVFTEDLIASAAEKNQYDIQEFKVIESSVFANADYTKSFIEMKNKFDVILIGLSKLIDGEWVVLKNPGQGTIIEPNDYIILIGSGQTQSDLIDALKVTEGRLNKQN